MASSANAGMHNTEGINVDLYIPRKWCAPDASPFFKALCQQRRPVWPLPLSLVPALPVKRSSATNRLIEAKDKASVQLNIGHVNGARTVAGCCQRSLASARRSQSWHSHDLKPSLVAFRLDTACAPR